VSAALTPPVEVASAKAARAREPEYLVAVGKVISSHVRNEIAGARVFDEPAIALAPNPKEKWLACRIAMEEYGHHLKFARLAADLGLAPDPDRVLSVFDYQLSTWLEFVVLKAIVDQAEVVVMEDLAGCGYLPLRSLARALLPEERFHVSFGQARTKALATDPRARPAVQKAIEDMVRLSLPFFGRSVSANNEMFRRLGIKANTNDESRAIFIERTRRFVETLGLEYPPASVHWDG
jgi:ring-1,2-phenylacetyl-CoA epoxidase subunit PaaA